MVVTFGSASLPSPLGSLRTPMAFKDESCASVIGSKGKRECMESELWTSVAVSSPTFFPLVESLVQLLVQIQVVFGNSKLSPCAKATQHCLDSVTLAYSITIVSPTPATSKNNNNQHQCCKAPSSRVTEQLPPRFGLEV